MGSARWRRPVFSEFGIRSLSTTNGAYWPMRYHAGTVWPYDTTMIVNGMLADGFVDEARSVAEGLRAAATSFDWRLPEPIAGVSRDASSRAIPYPAHTTLTSSYLSLTPRAGRSSAHR